MIIRAQTLWRIVEINLYKRYCMLLRYYMLLRHYMLLRTISKSQELAWARGYTDFGLGSSNFYTVIVVKL